MNLQKNLKEIDDYNKKAIAKAPKRKRRETVTRVLSGDTKNAKHRNYKIRP